MKKAKVVKKSDLKLINIKVSRGVHRMLVARAKEFQGGNLSQLLRIAGLNYNFKSRPKAG